jgi:predicted permease
MNVWRWWFRAAAIYNLISGLATVLIPSVVLDLAGVKGLSHISFFQCIGMMVAVYAIGYWFLAVNPRRYAAFIWVGLAGKAFGPIGYVYAASRGELPWSFGWFNFFNDVIWLPAFCIFAYRYARPSADQKWD